jgi:predicted glutamine amidotransferase
MAETERKNQIEQTFSRINKLIDEAYIRDQEKKAFQKIEQKEKEAQILASMEYDQKRRLEAIRNLERSQEIAREKLNDPLSFI